MSDGAALAGFARRELVEGLLRELDHLPRALRFMEVCGTHTMALFETGLRPLLRERGIELVSGPGCPVCVTAQVDLDLAIAIARQPEVICCTFGDMLRVPGSEATLEQLRGEGCDIRVVYSPLDSLQVARTSPDRPVVFLAVGFETTAPGIAVALREAEKQQLRNFFVHPLNKLVPPALSALVARGALRLDGLLLPGHVSVVIGAAAYETVSQQAQLPCAIAGFDPVDILVGVVSLVRQVRDGKPHVDNCYSRVVTRDGNLAARAAIEEVFQPVSAEWRGLGAIPGSGLDLRAEYRAHDARRLCPDFVAPSASAEHAACRCGDVLCGVIAPVECGCFGTSCTPDNPLGACMVSQEGACRAYYKHRGVA